MVWRNINRFRPRSIAIRSNILDRMGEICLDEEEIAERVRDGSTDGKLNWDMSSPIQKQNITFYTFIYRSLWTSDAGWLYIQERKWEIRIKRDMWTAWRNKRIFQDGCQLIEKEWRTLMKRWARNVYVLCVVSGKETFIFLACFLEFMTSSC